MRVVDKIYHISDVHIRNLKRHREYREVFKRLYRFIKKDSTKNSIIVLTGDMVHAKTDTSPEATLLQAEFYRSLANILPTVMIAGNHDCNLKNKNRLDAIEPVVNALDHPNLHYWKSGGTYKFNGLTFVVMSVFDPVDQYPYAEDVEGEFKIALYHGTVDRAETEIGFEIKHGAVPIQLFQGYDLALLGDIHKPAQYLNGEKTIAYPGSLIQQNHGEGLGHGILVWDLEKSNSKFVEIDNDYGYYTIYIHSGEIINEDWEREIPKKVRLRVVSENTDLGVVQTRISEIKQKTKVVELTQRNSRLKADLREASSKLSYENILDPEYQNKLLVEYFGTIENFDPELMGDVCELNRNLNGKIGDRDIVRNAVWKPIKFSFSNMFSYGPNNLIDFTNIKGLNGIFAPNASGKSSIFDALVFCLFDKCSRTSKAVHVMNNKKDTFKCLFEFELNGNRYFIKRSARRNPKHRHNVRLDVEFWMIDDTGKRHNLNGKQRDDTNKNIRDRIGTYDNFILTTMALQTAQSEFINAKQKERKEILSRFLDISIFSRLYAMASDEIKETSALIRSLKKKDFGTLLAESNSAIEIHSREYKSLLLEKSKHSDSALELNERIIDLTSKLHNIDSDINIEEFKVKYKKYNDTVRYLSDEVEELESKSIRISQSCYDKKEELVQYTKIELKREYDLFLQLRDDLSQLEIDRKRLMNDLEFKNKQASHLVDFEHDPNCEFCVNNPFVKDAKKAQSEIDELIVRLDELGRKKIQLTLDLEKYQSSYDKIVFAKELKLEIDKLNQEKDSLDLKIQKKDLECQSAMLKKTKIEEKIEEYYQNQVRIEENKKLQSEIDKLTMELKNVRKHLNVINDEMVAVSGKLKVAETNRDNSSESLQQLSELDRQYIVYAHYLDAMKHNGLPYYLIERLLPSLEFEINSILNQMVSFTVSLEGDGKNINAYIDYGDGRTWPVEMTSGMERFITSLSIRVALTNSSNLPRPNFIGIDEGFGVLDADNLSSIHLLFDFLRSQFGFILCISHLSSMRDVVDDVIEINKKDNFSKIVHQ